MFEIISRLWNRVQKKRKPFSLDETLYQMHMLIKSLDIPSFIIERYKLHENDQSATRYVILEQTAKRWNVKKFKYTTDVETTKKIEQLGKKVIKRMPVSRKRAFLIVTHSNDRFVVEIDNTGSLNIVLEIHSQKMFSWILEANLIDISQIIPILEAEDKIPQGLSRPTHAASAHQMLEASPALFLCSPRWEDSWNPQWRIFRDNQNLGIFQMPSNATDAPIPLAIFNLKGT